MLRLFVVKNINLVSIVVFLLLFAMIMITKPSIMFDKNGNGLLDTKEIKQAFKLMGNDLSDEEFEKLVYNFK